MIRSLIQAFAVGLLLAGSAAASERPALRASVTVEGSLVRIGDLVENAGPVADIPIFRAPDLGTTGAVTTERILEAIRPHQLVGIDTHGLTEVMVTRSSRAIAATEVAARIARVLSEQYKLAEARDISINFDRVARTLQVEASASGDLQVLALSFDPHTNRFDVTFDLPTSSQLQRQPVRFTGTAIETVETIGVDHPVERGEVLHASDLTVLRRPKNQTGAITEKAAVIGRAARHPLRPGQPLNAADLMKPEIVQRNETVTLVFEAPGLTLTLRGQAQESGALGDTIGVLNIQTKHIVQGVVSGPSRVTLGGTFAHLAANAAAPSPASEPEAQQ